VAEFRMPSLGADMERATVVHWLVQVGDRIERGQVVAEVETEKGVLEVESFESGIVEELLVCEGTTVAVGTPLARIGAVAGGEGQPVPGALSVATAGRAAPAVAPAAAPAITPTVAPAVAPAAASAITPTVAPAVASAAQSIEPAAAARPAAQTRGRRRISPAARALAESADIDLDRVEGTGPDDAVTLADVRRAQRQPTSIGAAEPPALATGEDHAAPSTSAIRPAAPSGLATDAARRAAMRASIAALMSRSKREIPHYYLSQEIDLERALLWLENENLRRPVEERLLPAALLLKAVATAAVEVPEMNGFFENSAFRASTAVHLGVAISLRDAGLIAPAILDADRRSAGELMAALRDLVRRARSGGLRASEMSSPTLTVTNLGDQGVTAVFGVIYPPQVAIVGFGKVFARATVEENGIRNRRMVTATLSADHRVSDGHRGAYFLAAVGRLLQRPEEL